MCLLKKHDAKYGLQENPKHAYAGEKRLTQPYSSLYFTQKFGFSYLTIICFNR